MNAPAFLRTKDVAERLGYSADHFYAIRPTLVRAGFPEPDPVLRRYLAADVEAWIESRSRTMRGVDKLPRASRIDFGAI